MNKTLVNVQQNLAGKHSQEDFYLFIYFLSKMFLCAFSGLILKHFEPHAFFKNPTSLFMICTRVAHTLCALIMT